MKYPTMHCMRQQFDTTSVEDVGRSILQELTKINVVQKIQPGQKVAISAGSRGIQHYATIVATVVEYLREIGLNPFILPAMGSHGGATAEGQVKLLKALGITESTVNAPIISNMEVVSIGRLDSGAEVVSSKDAFEADHVVIINRIKPHTAFRSEVESGLCKMLAIGCGKHQGALNMHKFGLASSIVPAAKILVKKISVLFGLAIVENALEQIHTIKAALPDQFVSIDKDLLHKAQNLLPRIPTDDLDVLVIDEMGKNISGTGIDPNIIGFWRRDGGRRSPDYRTLIVLNLTPESHGNALGIGMVDLTTKSFMDTVDLNATYANALTTGIWRSVRFPIALESDKAALDLAFEHIPNIHDARIIRITNTLSLATFWASGALLPELRKKGDILINENPLQFNFNDKGKLLPFP